MEEPGVEASQGFQGTFGSVSDLAVDLHVVVVITIVVDDLELPCEVHHEPRRTVERVGPVLEKEAISIRSVRDVEPQSAETEEGPPDALRAETSKLLMPRSKLAFKQRHSVIYRRPPRHPASFTTAIQPTQPGKGSRSQHSSSVAAVGGVVEEADLGSGPRSPAAGADLQRRRPPALRQDLMRRHPQTGAVEARAAAGFCSRVPCLAQLLWTGNRRRHACTGLSSRSAAVPTGFEPADG
ncbi:hypothetical protein SCOCK_300070 [Actinacidiphila cocklensis]|uniref:Uncharacterized protein n=1 Tax=Actinacidiphila cocklensis TaxID=887465 RepID=A0A9W4E8D5_9ACTN|nr:hypothetical protein SCOCK_300070 [Actinacidiphila cocklensis]